MVNFEQKVVTKKCYYSNISYFISTLERDVYYFENNRREEVVNYEAGGKGLGSNVSSKFGLNETETEVYKRSLSDLAGQMVRASQSSLATSRRSQESLDTVISSKRSDATSGTADKYGLNETEREVYRRSLGDLCNQMMRASQTSLNRTSSRTSSLDKVRYQIIMLKSGIRMNINNLSRIYMNSMQGFKKRLKTISN